MRSGSAARRSTIWRHRLRLDRQTGRRRVGNADARPQQAHVVVDFGDGRDGGARVFRGRLLLDRDCRGKPVDLVDVGLLHHLEELARVGRERLDIAALPLGVDRVEGERRLARAREAGEDDQLVARDREVDVLEVVLAGASHGDGAALEPGRGRRAERGGRRRRGRLDLRLLHASGNVRGVRPNLGTGTPVRHPSRPAVPVHHCPRQSGRIASRAPFGHWLSCTVGSTKPFCAGRGRG